MILISPYQPSPTVGAHALRTRKERRVCLDHFVLLFHAQGMKVNFVIGSMHTGLISKAKKINLLAPEFYI
jgi:hypothetical protein